MSRARAPQVQRRCSASAAHRGQGLRKRNASAAQLCYFVVSMLYILSCYYAALTPLSVVRIKLEFMKKGGAPRGTPWTAYFDKHQSFLVHIGTAATRALEAVSFARGQQNRGGGRGGPESSRRVPAATATSPSAAAPAENVARRVRACRHRRPPRKCASRDCNSANCKFSLACASCGADRSANTCQASPCAFTAMLSKRLRTALPSSIACPSWIWCLVPTVW